MRPLIDYIDGSPKGADGPIVLVYVGGPRDGTQEVHWHPPPAAVLVPAAHGLYQRSLRCADDGGLRYVWTTDERD